MVEFLDSINEIMEDNDVDDFVADCKKIKLEKVEYHNKAMQSNRESNGIKYKLVLFLFIILFIAKHKADSR